jgi:hypothetical protein
MCALTFTYSSAYQLPCKLISKYNLTIFINTFHVTNYIQETKSERVLLIEVIHHLRRMCNYICFFWPLHCLLIIPFTSWYLLYWWMFILCCVFSLVCLRSVSCAKYCMCLLLKATSGFSYPYCIRRAWRCERYNQKTMQWSEEANIITHSSEMMNDFNRCCLQE